MTLGTLIVRNLRRHPLRVTLTALGIATAILAFNFIITTVRAWYAGVEASAQNRLITRHAASLSIHLPLAHRDQLEAIPGSPESPTPTGSAVCIGTPKAFSPNTRLSRRLISTFTRSFCSLRSNEGPFSGIVVVASSAGHSPLNMAGA